MTVSVPEPDPLVTAEGIGAAVERIRAHVLRTPLLPSRRLSDELGARVFLKPENLQHTGSFKVRGAFNALLARADGRRASGRRDDVLGR